MSTFPTPLAERFSDMHSLASEEFDLCIIGAGASGAGCALDAALRGLKVALVERDDFSSGTSSRSTKLVHGGVRYLEQAVKKGDIAQLRQVHHGLRERHRVLANAPHLARPLALLTPVSSWWEGLYYRIGLAIYDAFSWHSDTLPRPRWLSRKQALQLMPGLSPHIHSAVLYYDGQLDDARYCIALALSAAEAGAVVVNHARVTKFRLDTAGRIVAAEVSDGLADSYQTSSTTATFSIRAKCFLNCTGPFSDAIRLLANPALPLRIRPSKGIHVVLPYSTLGGDAAMLIPQTSDGRIVFAVPYQGQVLLGTTDEDYPDPDVEAVVESREVDFLLDTLNPYLAQPVENRQVQAGFGGLRPLVQPLAEGASSAGTGSLLRDHEVERDPVSGLFSLLGGKWTTYRLMAQDALDAVCRQLGMPCSCRTDAYPLIGAAGFKQGLWKKLALTTPLKPEIVQHLAQQYGSRVPLILQMIEENPSWAKQVVPAFPFIQAEVIYAIRYERACTLRDVLSRRIRLETLHWQATRDAAPVVASLMQAELGWSEQYKATALADYLMLLQQFTEHSGIA